MADVNRKELFAGLKRVVIKLGTQVLTGGGDKPDMVRLRRMAREVAAVRERGIEVVIVTSGAVGVGMGALGLKERPRLVPRLQAAAAVGQNRLIHLYETVFSKYGIAVGQVLLTAGDLQHRTGYNNVRNTLAALLEFGAVPVINENDSVAVEELAPARLDKKNVAGGVRFGDNDSLSAQVANLVGADLLIILTDIDGLYSADPKKNADAHLIDTVEKITPRLYQMAGREGSLVSVGGMRTKLRAARIVTESGEMMVIGNGYTASIKKIIDGQPIGTLFLPGRRKTGKKRWLAYTSSVHGRITVDAGARRALEKGGKSLLPSGITVVKGRFAAGDTVEVCDQTDTVFARGKICYSDAQLRKIAGKKSTEITGLLGNKHVDEAIHRDNLVVL